MPTPLVVDPLLSDDDAEAMVRLWHDFPRYGLYSNEGFDTNFAPELAQRYDAAINFIRTGGRLARKDPDRSLMAARTNYFRETFLYGTDVVASGIERFANHERLVAAARELHGRPVVVPAIVYANILLPGQELAVHTDVGEFRGANRKVVPQWLIVVMFHSGLFEEWRMPIATGIAYFGGGRGGELAYYPDGPDRPAATYAPKHNTAAMLDTDAIFHGVDRVLGDDAPLRALRPGMELVHDGDRRWSVRDPHDDNRTIARYVTDDLRYSVSWKAYCFRGEDERDAWVQHLDDLTLDLILERLTGDLRKRGRLQAGEHGLSEAELGRVMIDEYVHFPTPVPS